MVSVLIMSRIYSKRQHWNIFYCLLLFGELRKWMNGIKNEFSFVSFALNDLRNTVKKRMNNMINMTLSIDIFKRRKFKACSKQKHEKKTDKNCMNEHI